MNKPVYQILEATSGLPPVAYPKIAYGSVLFGDTPEETKRIAQRLKAEGYKAAKFGWGPMGKNETNDIALVKAAREGLGDNIKLMVDAGVTWRHDWKTAYSRSVSFSKFNLTWLEEPLLPDAIVEYGNLTKMKPHVPIACGEGSSSYRFAEDIILNGGIQFIQIDAGRCGGITTAYRIRKLAEQHGIQYVNHTFKSHLSLAAAIHVFATNPKFDLLEYPAGGSEMARTLSSTLEKDPNGLVQPLTRPGLGVRVNLDVVKKFLVPLKIEIASEVIFSHSKL
jgi:L-alanine-DL-glutamate epimerase-like enolase superfamily enzyme